MLLFPAPLAGAAGNYRLLMEAVDATGLPASYHSTEERFRIVKDLELRNLVIPVVGDFAGPLALRGIGDWLRARGATVDVFYLSNVEDYLTPARVRTEFCRNVATLPIDDRSEFIRTSHMTLYSGSEIPTRMMWSADRTTVVMNYADGHTQQMSSDEANALIRSGFGHSVTRTALIGSDLRTCQ
jgi:hypothetical protein